MGIHFYDQELVDRAIKDTGFSESFIREAGEYASTTSNFLFHMKLASSSGGTRETRSPYDQIYIAQNNIILKLAEQEPCVIVGRCADYILRNRSDCLNIFIHAAKEARINRVLEQYGEYAGMSIQERLKDKDQKRRLYYKHYTGREWGNVQNYQLSFDSSVVGLKRGTDWITELYLSK